MTEPRKPSEAELLLVQWSEAVRPDSIATTEPEWAEGFDFLWGATQRYLDRLAEADYYNEHAPTTGDLL